MESRVVAALTRRERQVLELAARGMSNKQIGAELSLTQETVKHHLHHIYRKLGVANRTAAAAALLTSTR